MKILLVIIGVALVTVPPVRADTELKGTPTELAAYLAGLPKTVNVTGESEVKVQADRAIITLKVSTEKKSLADALRSNEEVRNQLADFLKGRGLGSDQIRASRFSSTQKYGVFSEKAKSHRVDNLIKVTARDEKEFQTIASATDKFAEVSYIEAVFEHSGKESLKAKAIAQACDNATSHKKVFEEKLGLKLTPRRFTEGTVPIETPVSRPSFQGGSAPRATPIPGIGDSRVFEAGSEPISAFGELVFKVFVTVEYSVESK